MKSLLSLLGALALAAVLTGCDSNAETPEAKAVPPAGTVELTEQQLKNMDIILAQAEYQPIESSVYVYGKVVALPNLQAAVSSDIEAKVENVLVQEGMQVRKGQTLVTLRSMQLIELQNEYLTAKSEKDFLAIEYKRQEELRRNNVGALVDLQTVEAKLNAAISREKALRAKLELLSVDVKELGNPNNANIVANMSIKSPIDGYIYNLPVTIGMVAQPATIIAQIVNTDELLAKFYVYEKDIHLIEEGQVVDIDFVNGTIPSAQGRVIHISRALDESTKAIEVHVRFSAPKGSLVLPDMNVKAQILNRGDSKPAFTVPFSAILQEEDQYYVFTTDEKKTATGGYTFVKRKIQLGDKNEEVSEIIFPNPVVGDFKIAKTNVMILEGERKNRAQ